MGGDETAATNELWQMLGEFERLVREHQASKSPLPDVWPEARKVRRRIIQMFERERAAIERLQQRIADFQRSGASARGR